MIALALRGLASRKLRAGLTAFAIVLGVAMIAGTLMLSASVNRSFDDIFAAANEGIDVSVEARSEGEGGFAPENESGIPASLLDRILKQPGVADAAGGIGDSQSIAILDDDGERIGPDGPPHIAFSVQREPFTAFTLVDGADPAAGDEVAIDNFLADSEGLEPGDRLAIAGLEGAKDYTVSGILEFGSGVPLGGASLAVFTLAEAQRITDKRNQFDAIAVRAEDGVSPQQLKVTLAAALPDTVEVKTGTEVAEDSASDIKDGFSFITIALLAFAGIAVFVGAFLIFNTFAITVAQRTREFGMLRTLGASSRQVLGAVMIEAAVLGLLASGIGIGAGIGFVELISSVFSAIGFELPTSGLVINAHIIVIPLMVGMVSTLGSALVPALRATRVTPIEALSELGEASEGGSRRRTVIAAILLGAAVVILTYALVGSGSVSAALPLLGVGLATLFVGVTMLGGKLVSPLASVVGKPIEMITAVVGRLARENTLRNPSRTGTTSAALMIGVALVVFALVFVAAINRSIDDALDRTFVGDLAVYNVDGFSPIPPRVATDLGDVDGVRSVSPVSYSGGKLKGESGQEFIAGLEPSTFNDGGKLDWLDGSDSVLDSLGAGEAIVEVDWASDNDISVGESLDLVAPNGTDVSLRTVGSVRDPISAVIDSVAVTRQSLRSDFGARQDFFDIVTYESGAEPDPTRKRVDDLLAERFPNAEARSQTELKDENREQLNGLLALILVLLSLSVAISLFGVVNTLVLTVYERTREIGMLRAIGSSKRQIRRMIRYESLITAMIGALIGMVLGIVIAVATVKALADEGLVLEIPAVAIIVLMFAAAIAGVLAGIWPARRAAKIEVMEALHYE